MAKKIVLKHQQVNALCAEAEELGHVMGKFYGDEYVNWSSGDVMDFEHAAARFQALADKMRAAVKEVPDPKPVGQN